MAFLSTSWTSSDIFHHARSHGRRIFGSQTAGGNGSWNRDGHMLQQLTTSPDVTETEVARKSVLGSEAQYPAASSGGVFLK